MRATILVLLLISVVSISAGHTNSQKGLQHRTRRMANEEFALYNARVKDSVNVWLDMDPGNDDAVAMFMVLNSKQIKVKGFVGMFGNTQGDWALDNGKKLLAYFGHSDIPVYQGALHPITEWKKKSMMMKATKDTEVY